MGKHLECLVYWSNSEAGEGQVGEWGMTREVGEEGVHDEPWACRARGRTLGICAQEMLWLSPHLFFGGMAGGTNGHLRARREPDPRTASKSTCGSLGYGSKSLHPSVLPQL